MIISDEQNIVVLKNVPSNIVEQAIIVLKPHLKLKSKNGEINANYNLCPKSWKSNNTHNADYAINEAKIIVSDYVRNIEQDLSSKKEKHMQKKYKKLLILTYIVTALFLILLTAMVLNPPHLALT